VKPITLPLFTTDAQGNVLTTPALADSKPPTTLRPYQQRAIANLRAQIILGKKRILCVGPTGVGKTVITAAIIRTATIPCLFIAHRLEIIDQCAEQLQKAGITNIGVIRGNDDRYNPAASVQVGSIQTLSRRDKPFPGKPVIIIIDEAHRASSDSYRNLLSHYPDAIVIGFTATPTRLDGRALGGDLFEELLLITTYGEMLKRPDWLVAPDVYAAPVKADLSQVRIAGSDFDDEQLATVMHTDRLEGGLVAHYLRLAHLHPVFTDKGERMHAKFIEGERRRGFVFCVNIEHSMSVAAKFEAAGVRAVHLDGETPEHLRRAMLKDLATGAIEIVTNCNVALEGVDVPEAKFIGHARPTQSLTLFRQSVGRCMRPWNNVVPLLLDHASNFDRLGCPFEDLHWTLTSKPVRASSRAPMKLCKACFAYVEAGRVLCPYCGYEFTAEDSARANPTETNAELQQRQCEPDTLKRDYFERQLTLAKAKGFKPGFPAALYKDRYGVWPPREWSNKAKADFASDGAWQASLQRRLERKAKREAQEKIEKEQMEAAHSPEERALEQTLHAMDASVGGGYPIEEQPVEAEETFSDWLNDQGIT
jgi:DNA repair protein RadD